MKKTIAILILILSLAAPAAAAEYLIPVGEVVGLQLDNGTVTVAAVDSRLAADTPLQAGDRLLRIAGRQVRCAADVSDALRGAQGTVEVTVLRGGKELQWNLTPMATAEGPRLGVYLREGITGIGTITFYDPDTGKFGTLGHGVSDPAEQLLSMTEGTAYRARVLSVRRGAAGEPGQLLGSFCDTIGVLERNTEKGVFGNLRQIPSGAAVEVARPDEVKPGGATIRCCVSEEGVREYSVEILKVYAAGRSGGRNLLLRVTDPALLEATGGIVQGMSGSPIIQDGKLVGAITHVLVNDPTTGYGIFIENMLDAAA